MMLSRQTPCYGYTDRHSLAWHATRKCAAAAPRPCRSHALRLRPQTDSDPRSGQIVGPTHGTGSTPRVDERLLQPMTGLPLYIPSLLL